MKRPIPLSDKGKLQVPVEDGFIYFNYPSDSDIQSGNLDYVLNMVDKTPTFEDLFKNTTGLNGLIDCLYYGYSGKDGSAIIVNHAKAEELSMADKQDLFKTIMEYKDPLFGWGGGTDSKK